MSTTTFWGTLDPGPPPPPPNGSSAPQGPPAASYGAYLTAALSAEESRTASAQRGTRNHTLNCAAFSLGTLVHLGLDEATIRACLERAAVQANALGDPDSPAKIRATISSGLRAGKIRPRQGVKPSTTSYDPLTELPDDARPVGVRGIRASTIRIERVRWVWDGRLAEGTFSLLAGREGIGKSSVAYWMAARLTQGELPGIWLGHPRSVLVCATEDSWAHVIVPRLMAAGADLERILRVDVETEDSTTELLLPRDVAGMGALAVAEQASLALLDPLMSRLSSGLDTHKDADVRRALEPLGAMAIQCRLAVLGLAHHSKAATSDPLTLVMGSRAFTAVARSVHTVVAAEEEGGVRMFGTVKNNLGPTDLATLTFTLSGEEVTDPVTAEVVATSRVVWGEASRVGIREAIELGQTSSSAERSERSEAAAWLEDYLTQQGGTARSSTVKTEARKAGHADRTLHRAANKLQVVVESIGFPRATWWSLPGTQRP